MNSALKRSATTHVGQGISALILRMFLLSLKVLKFKSHTGLAVAQSALCRLWQTFGFWSENSISGHSSEQPR